MMENAISAERQRGSDLHFLRKQTAPFRIV